jgi:predicted O-methyltransferase YrrM
VTSGEKLSDWIVKHSASSAFQELADQLKRRFSGHASFTALEEVALLYSLIQYLRPPLCLEIGTLFADTSRILAEAIVNGNCPTKLVTIDPFGAHRAPGIIAGWPEELRKVVEYKPISSMDFFLELEDARVPVGGASPLGLVFVDGHHSFQYALFDILSASYSLRPSGAIVVDNMEQDGPRSAVSTFLSWNPAWTLFYDGKLLSGASAEGSISEASVSWSVLLPPEEIQISRLSRKLNQYGLRNERISGIKFDIRQASGPGELHFFLIYQGFSPDFHITGKGHQNTNVVGTLQISPGNLTGVVNFDPLVLNVPADSNISCELELRFQGEQNAFVLLSSEAPFTLLTAE